MSCVTTDTTDVTPCVTPIVMDVAARARRGGFELGEDLVMNMGSAENFIYKRRDQYSGCAGDSKMLEIDTAIDTLQVVSAWFTRFYEYRNLYIILPYNTLQI